MPSPWVKILPWYYTGRNKPSRTAEKRAALEYEERASKEQGTADHGKRGER